MPQEDKERKEKGQEAGQVTRREALKTVAGAGLALVMAGRVSAATDQWVAVGKSETFVAGKPQRVTVKDGGVLYITRTDAKTLLATSAKCTHRGCQVEWTADASQFQCPCHGAAFAPSGANIHGTRRSPNTPLPALISLPVRENAGQVEVNLGTVPADDIEPEGY